MTEVSYYEVATIRETSRKVRALIDALPAYAQERLVRELALVYGIVKEAKAK
jgi:hypothetical protein